LNDDPHVLPETAQRIRELAELCHYRPNRLTQSLFSGKSQSIGCLMPFVDTVFFSQILRGILEAAHQNSYHVTIVQTHFQMLHTRAALQELVERRVEGILIATSHLEPIPMGSLLDMWSHDIVPIAIDSTTNMAGVDHVTTDEQQLAEIAVGYLYHLGHRRIGFVGPRFHGFPSKRMLKVRQNLRTRGLSTDYCVASEVSPVVEIEQLLRKPNPPTALITFMDEEAAQAILLARRLGIRVPEDLSIMGVGNLNVCDLVDPAITSIEQFPERIGREAVALLMQRLQEGGSMKEGQRQPKIIATAPKLIERGSCAPPRADR
jgi:LacI family transcriptional regulator